MTLPIADCRLLIAELSPRSRFARCGHNGRQVVRLLEERSQFAFGNDSGLGKQLKPQRGFVRFLFHRSHLRNKFSFASGAATRAIIRGHRGATPNDLFGNNSPRIIALRNRPRGFDNSKRKSFGALLEFGGIHLPTLRNQSAIANRQSAML